mgnify:CR=1 FL=1
MNYVTDDTMNAYLRTVQPLFDGVLGEIQREAMAADVPIVPPEVARFISVLLTMQKPKHILEIGTAVAFSASMMCQFLPEDGTVTTIDRFEVMLKDARVNIKRMGLEDKIKILEGDAANILPTLEGPYDVIFMDAAKGQYLHFFDDIMQLLAKDGLLVSDNVLQDGDIVKSRYAIIKRNRTIHSRMRDYLYLLTHHEDLKTVILPLGDGVTLSTKLN